MNNIFIEGPIQTGKSTILRKILKDLYGPDLAGVCGFTSQRISGSDGNLLGFRLAPADADLSVTLDSFNVRDIAGVDNVFKRFTPDGPQIDMGVFENTGIRYMDEALAKAKAGDARIILLDEIGGHELASNAFRAKLYELLDSAYPCAGVIKSPANTERMDPALMTLNQELHDRIGSILLSHSFREDRQAAQALTARLRQLSVSAHIPSPPDARP